MPVDAASRALRGDVDGSPAIQEPSSRLLAAEIADMLERAGSFARGASEVVAWELEPIAAQGENCLKRGEVQEAITLLSTLGAGICAGYEKIWDEESEVGLVIDRCVLGLEACLDRAETSARGDILGALPDIAVWGGRAEATASANEQPSWSSPVGTRRDAGAERQPLAKASPTVVTRVPVGAIPTFR